MSRVDWRTWARLRRVVLQRDGYRCQLCGKAGRLDVDHRIRKEDGGGDELGNLQALCRTCHIAKTVKENTQDYRIEWRAYLADLTRRH